VAAGAELVQAGGAVEVLEPVGAEVEQVGAVEQGGGGG
jgi:hypothetical protein